MISNTNRDTKPELAVRSAAHRLGLRYRVAARPIAGLRRTADMVFVGPRVAVFIDGCFWHGCPKHYSEPATNRHYWSSKVDSNSRRDRETDQFLSEAGWTVMRFWEHQDPEEVAIRIESAVRDIRGRRKSEP